MKNPTPMVMTFPAYVHGMLKTDSFSGADAAQRYISHVEFQRSQGAIARPEPRRGAIFAERCVGDGRCAADLVDYPYGCTEQTLNRFLPTVITQKVSL